MRVTDPRAIRALAHPVRLDLIELLGAIGPATAATCARHLGGTQAGCSFHLRQLAKYGYVEQAPATGDRRERPWRLTDSRQDIDRADVGAAQEMSRVFVEREAVRILDWLATRAADRAEWRGGLGVSGHTLPVTVDELVAIQEGFRAVLAPYDARVADPAQAPDGARFVRFFLAATPLPALDRAATGVDEPAMGVAGSASGNAEPASAATGLAEPASAGPTGGAAHEDAASAGGAPGESGP